MIPFFTLERQNKILKKQLEKAIREVVNQGMFILGAKVAEFEREFAKYLGIKYAVGVASGTDALTLSLMAVGVGAGDEVILPANAYPTAFAVTAIGAIPKLVDIDPLTFNINPAEISGAITKKTKAIIPVHLYGQPADLEKIREIGMIGGIERKRKIYIVEDCAQAHGAEIRVSGSWYQVSTMESRNIQNTKYKIPNTKTQYKQKVSEASEEGKFIWRKVGSIGDIGCFSFYPTKNLGCFGDGGMVVTNNQDIYRRVKLLRMYGEEARYKSVALGRNSRLDELQAAILLVKLKYLDEWNKRRREIAKKYQISNIPACAGRPTCAGRKYQKHISKIKNLQLPYEASYVKHVFHLFVIRTKKRDRLKKYLKEKGIGTAIHYPTPIHLVPAFKYLGYKKGDFKESERASREILSLPIYPELKSREIERVVGTIREFFRN